MHPKEFRKTKNGTGHMTNNSLENCELHVGIDFSNHKRVNELLNDKNYEAYVLYPDTNSIKLNTQKLPSEKKALIFIIDSTWPTDVPARRPPDPLCRCVHGESRRRLRGRPYLRPPQGQHGIRLFQDHRHRRNPPHAVRHQAPAARQAQG